MAVTIAQPELVSSGPEGDTYRFSWSSDLVGPSYRVFQNGLPLNAEAVGQSEACVTVAPGEVFLLEVLDTNNPPTPSFSGRATLGWPSVAGAVSYTVLRQVAGTWVTFRVVPSTGQSFYSVETDLLTNNTTHAFRIIATGDNGVASQPMEVSVVMVRHPDAPVLVESYDAATGQLTVSEAV